MQLLIQPYAGKRRSVALPASCFYECSRGMLLLLLIIGYSLLFASAQAAEKLNHFELVIAQGTLIDGSGAQAFLGDVGIRHGRIVAVGDLGAYTADEVISVPGLVVAPGFIDTHSHAEEGLIQPDLKINTGFVTQGVTTSVFGVDGGHSLAAIQKIRSLFEQQGVATNYLFYLGHNGVRRAVMGMDNRLATAAELEQMKGIVLESMQQGMLGLSSGLMYLPGRYAGREELVELATVTRAFNGLYDSHIRDPAHHLMDSIEECLEIGRLAGVEPHLAHLKAVGKANFGTVPLIVDAVNQLRASGTPVTADVYPYDGAAARKLVTVLIPPSGSGMGGKLRLLADNSAAEKERAALLQELTQYWQKALQQPELKRQIREATEQPPDGVFSWVDAVGYGSFRVVVSDVPGAQGRMVTDLAREQGIEPFDVIVDLILAEGSRSKITLGAIQESEVRMLLKQPWVMISSDGKLTHAEDVSGHPRFRGSFPRVLGRYVREWKVISLEDAVHKMTGLPANYLKLKDRGLLKAGYWADITVFNPATVIDRATWEHPARYSEGIIHVMVNGEWVLRDSRMTGRTPGRFVPYQGTQR